MTGSFSMEKRSTKGVPGHASPRDLMPERPGSYRVWDAYPLRTLLPVRTRRTRRWLFCWMMAISIRPVSTRTSQARFTSTSAPRRLGGQAIERAGLTNGDLYGVKISVNGKPVAEESNLFGLGTSTFVGSGRFSLHNLGDVSSLSALQLEQASIVAGVARLRRVEDGAWDPREEHSNDFYFVTTADINTNSRLWRLRFDDIEHPENGGTIEILLNDDRYRMLDNVTIDRLGRIFMDEDPGNNNRVSKIWLYSIATGDLVQVAEHNPKFFDPTIPNNGDFITQDEESSGIIDASHILGEGWFLLDVQVHKVNNTDSELVEGGQLLAMFVDPGIGGD